MKERTSLSSRDLVGAAQTAGEVKGSSDRCLDFGQRKDLEERQAAVHNTNPRRTEKDGTGKENKSSKMPGGLIIKSNFKPITFDLVSTCVLFARALLNSL